MFRLRRWYNQNSKKIWKVTGIIVFLIIILQLLNYFAGKNNNKKYVSNVTESSIKNEYTDLSLESDKSVLSNEKITNTEKKAIETINTFFAYCKKGNVKDAYELLTDECKEKMYPNLKDFEESYYKPIFSGGKKDITLENWIGNTYKVEFREDALISGQYSENAVMQDYITTKSVENGYKLNINKYVDTEEIDKSVTYNGIQIDVNKKDVFMEYEEYYFIVKNNLNEPILLDNLKDIQSMYLKDKNNIKYLAYTHEISTSELLINAREEKKVKIKYYNKFGSQKSIDKVVFSKVILEYNNYKSLQGNNIFSKYEVISIDV